MTIPLQTSIAKEVNLQQHIAIGKKIYDRSFGRGCGACHDISSNPQLVELITAKQLDKDVFNNVLENGKNAMPKATAAIMAVGPVVKANYNKYQAFDAVYTFLEYQGNQRQVSESDVIDIPADDETNAFIITLNADLSFTIPRLEYFDQTGNRLFFEVDFVFSPEENRLLFEPVSIRELGSADNGEQTILLNGDLSFEISFLKYIAPEGEQHNFQVEFSFFPSTEKLLFQVINLTEI